MQDLKDYLREWRKRHTMTQAAAADALGIVLATYRGLEAGRPTPYGKVIKMAISFWEKGDGPRSMFLASMPIEEQRDGEA
jgi:DNA-binding XRE family transcriptional regulator